MVSQKLHHHSVLQSPLGNGWQFHTQARITQTFCLCREDGIGDSYWKEWGRNCARLWCIKGGLRASISYSPSPIQNPEAASTSYTPALNLALEPTQIYTTKELICTSGDLGVADLIGLKTFCTCISATALSLVGPDHALCVMGWVNTGSAIGVALAG